MVRYPKDDRPKPLLCEGGSPIVFETELQATQAVLQNVLRYVNGPDYRRSGETLPTKRSEAEKQFGAIYIKGREVKIERKERAKA